MGWDLPEHSFVHGRDGVLIASPELLFLELSASYSSVELMKLGMELCGTYAIDPYVTWTCAQAIGGLPWGLQGAPARGVLFADAMLVRTPSGHGVYSSEVRNGAPVAHPP